jgi:hypothetical protein
VTTSPCSEDLAPPPGLPLELRWGGPDNPLPVRNLRPRGRHAFPLPQLLPPPWLNTGPTDRPFDFCGHVRRLVADIAKRCLEFQHLDVSRLLFAVTQARTGRVQGLQARVTPMRFRGGALVRRRRGVAYQVQRFVVGESDMLYQVTFCLPRFHERDFDDKLVTIFHELYHISPKFDGDLRRFGGRYAVHSHSKRGYDAHMTALAREYLAGRPEPVLHDFLRLSFGQLVQRHGHVVGVVVPRPKLVPLLCRPDG